MITNKSELVMGKKYYVLHIYKMNAYWADMHSLKYSHVLHYKELVYKGEFENRLVFRTSMGDDHYPASLKEQFRNLEFYDSKEETFRRMAGVSPYTEMNRIPVSKKWLMKKYPEELI